MKNIKFVLNLVVAVIVAQGFAASAYAAKVTNAAVGPAASTAIVAPQVTTPGKALPASVQPLNADEMQNLLAAEAKNKGLLEQMAGDSRTVCHEECALGGGCREVCDTVDTSSGSGGGHYSRSGMILSFVILGVVFGSFGGPSGAVLGGAAAGGFAAIMTSN